MDYKVYYGFLKGRSRLACFYRQFYLYRRISRFLYGPLLDVGCGIGDFLAFYGQAIGVDSNPYNVRHCQDRGLKAFLIDGTRIPFKGKSFDGAVMDNVLEHLSDPEDLLMEIYRILKPKGRFIVGVPGSYGYYKDDDHRVFYDEKALISRLEASGFLRQSMFYMPFRSSALERSMSQYCIYGVFKKPGIS